MGDDDGDISLNFLNRGKYPSKKKARSQGTCPGGVSPWVAKKTFD